MMLHHLLVMQLMATANCAGRCQHCGSRRLLMCTSMSHITVHTLVYLHHLHQACDVHSSACCPPASPHRLTFQLIQRAPLVARLVQLQRVALPGVLLPLVLKAAQAHQAPGAGGPACRGAAHRCHSQQQCRTWPSCRWSNLTCAADQEAACVITQHNQVNNQHSIWQLQLQIGQCSRPSKPYPRQPLPNLCVALHVPLHQHHTAAAPTATHKLFNDVMGAMSRPSRPSGCCR